MIVIEYPYWASGSYQLCAVYYKDPHDGYFNSRWSWIFLLED